MKCKCEFPVFRISQEPRSAAQRTATKKNCVPRERGKGEKEERGKKREGEEKREEERGRVEEEEERKRIMAAHPGKKIPYTVLYGLYGIRVSTAYHIPYILRP